MAVSVRETNALARIGADIASGEARLRAQRRHVVELRAQGRETLQAQEIISAMTAALDALRNQRQRIVEELRCSEAERCAEPGSRIRPPG